MARISPVIWVLIISFGVLLITISPIAFTQFNLHLPHSRPLPVSLIPDGFSFFRTSISENNIAITLAHVVDVKNTPRSVVLDLLSSLRNNKTIESFSPSVSPSPKSDRAGGPVIVDVAFSSAPVDEPSSLSVKPSYVPHSVGGKDLASDVPMANISNLPRYNSTTSTTATPYPSVSQTVTIDSSFLPPPAWRSSVEPSSSFGTLSESSPFASTNDYDFMQWPFASTSALAAPVGPQASYQVTRTPSPSRFSPLPSRDNASKINPTITLHYYSSMSATYSEISPSLGFDEADDESEAVSTSFNSDQPTDDGSDISMEPDQLHSVSLSPLPLVIVAPTSSRTSFVSSSTQMTSAPSESPSNTVPLSASPLVTAAVSFSESASVSKSPSPCILPSESMSFTISTSSNLINEFPSTSVSVSVIPSATLASTASVSVSTSVSDDAFPFASASIPTSSTPFSSASFSAFLSTSRVPVALSTTTPVSIFSSSVPLASHTAAGIPSLSGPEPLGSLPTAELASVDPEIAGTYIESPTNADYSPEGTISQLLSHSPNTGWSSPENLGNDYGDDTIPYSSNTPWEETPFPSNDILIVVPPAGGNQIGEITNPAISSQDGIMNQESGESSSPPPTAPVLLVSPSPSSPVTEIIPPIGGSTAPFDISPSVSPLVSSSTTSATPSFSSIAMVSPLVPPPSPVGGPSQAPETVTDSDTPIVPSTIGPSGYPSISAAPTPPQPEIVPDTNDTGIVIDPSGSPNTTLADNPDDYPSIVAGGQWKDLLNTGPAGLAFSIIMGIVGVLLVIFLLVCLILALLRGPKSGSYTSQLSGSGGAPFVQEGIPGVASRPYIVESPPPSFSQPPPGSYEDGGSYRGFDMRNDGAAINYETPSDLPYSGAGGTTLRNASVGTAEYPTSTQLLPVLNTNNGDGALTGHDRKEYHYEHPYGQTYRGMNGEIQMQDAMRIFMGSQNTDPRARVISESRPYSSEGTQEIYGDEAGGTYDSAAYGGDDTIVTFEDNVNSISNWHMHEDPIFNPGNEQGSMTNHNPHEGKNADDLTREYGSAEDSGISHRPRTVQFAKKPYSVIQTGGIYPPSPREPSESLVRSDPDESPGQIDEQIYDDERNLDFSSDSMSPTALQGSTYPSTESDAVLHQCDSMSQVDVAEDLSANGAGSNEVSSFVAVGYHRVSDEQPDEDGSASFKRYASLAAAQQQAFSLAVTGSPHSQTSSMGPWPLWWKRASEHTENVTNISTGYDVRENSFAPVHGFEDDDEHSATACPVYQEDEDNNSDHEVQLGFDNAGSLFGPKLAFVGSEWQNDAHDTIPKQEKLPNPQFDYLRKLREPYVKAMANKLSLRALSSSTTTESVRDDTEKEQKAKAQKKKSINSRYSVPWSRFMNGEQVLHGD